MAGAGDGFQAQESLRESAELFRVLAETSLDIIRLIEPGGRVVYSSPSVPKFLGKYPATQFENIHPDDLEAAEKWWKHLLDGGTDRFDWRICAGDGAWHWLESWGTPLEYKGKAHVLMLCRDVTERVRTVEELRESQRKLEDAQEIAHIGYWANDLETDQITWSEETYRILGLKAGKDKPSVATLKDLIYPDDLHIQLEASARAQRGEGRYDVEYRIVRPNGELRTVHSVGDVVRDKTGKPCRAFGVVQDITELKSAEHALRESHGLLNAVIQGTSDAVFAKNTEGRYVLMNAAGARFLGKSVAEVIGHADPELFPPEIAGALMDRDRQVIESGSSYTFEEEHIVEGSPRTYVVTKSAYRDWNGEVIGLVGISSDVTELKRLEKQFREAQKMEAVGRLAGGIAHDFNNLLTVINSYSEMMLADLPPNHDDREPLTEIRKAGDRAANLTHQLLAFSRNQILQPRVVNLNATLPDLVNLLSRLIGTDIDLTFLTDGNLGLTRVDPMQLDQAIINLAVNARDAMPGGGRLTIETRNEEITAQTGHSSVAIEPGHYVVVSVKDSGHGMDEATKARVFEPFFTTKQPGKGTGLGLAMVYGFVRQSGGHIEMDSKPEHGTVFTIFLPRSEDPDSTTTADKAPKSPVGIETILLVEDEEAVRALSRIILESCGYTVIEARNGQEGLAIVEGYKSPIHIVVTDLIMPVVNGRDLAEQVARVRPETLILFMSGHTDVDMLPTAVTESKQAFLQKPFTPGELARKVRDVLDGADQVRRST